MYPETKTLPGVMVGSCNLGSTIHFECSLPLSPSLPYTGGHGSPAALFKPVLFCNSLIKHDNVTTIAEGTLSFAALTQSRRALANKMMPSLGTRQSFHLYMFTAASTPVFPALRREAKQRCVTDPTNNSAGKSC